MLMPLAFDIQTDRVENGEHLQFQVDDKLLVSMYILRMYLYFC